MRDEMVGLPGKAPNIQRSGARPAEASMTTNISGRARRSQPLGVRRSSPPPGAAWLSDGRHVKADRIVHNGSSMRATPNNALRRTRSTALAAEL